MSLTKQAISKMFALEFGKEKLYTVEVIRLVLKKGYCTMLISDGEKTTTAIIQGNENIKEFKKYEGEEKFKLLIHSFKSLKRFIELLDWQIVVPPAPNVKLETKSKSAKNRDNEMVPEIKPSALKIEDKPSERDSRTVKKETPPPSSIGKKSVELTKNSTGRKLMINLYDEENEEQTRPFEMNEMNEADDFDIKGFQKIQDLFIGMHAWELLLRVVGKNYKQFVSKKGKEINLLTIDFIDQAGWTIEGWVFGTKAEEHNRDIEEGKVYRVARTALSEQNFKKDKKQNKKSPLTLKFHNDSSIIKVREVPEIPFSSQNITRLEQISKDEYLNQQHDVMTVLLQIGPLRTIPKFQKQIIMQKLTVGDPISNIVMEVTIWNNQINIDESFLNKTILLKHFKLTKYKDSYNLSSVFNSSISKQKYFQDYENKWKPQLKKENHFSIKTFKELEKELATLQPSEIIVSYVDAYINNFCFGQKWYYDSCPNEHCRKSVEPLQECQNCRFYIEQPVKRFTLLVELCDSTGSLYATAFHEAAEIFLKKKTIEELAEMTEHERHIFSTRLAYDNYIVKLISKIDNSGRFKHTISQKPEEVDAAKRSQMNLQIINNILREEPIRILFGDE